MRQRLMCRAWSASLRQAPNLRADILPESIPHSKSSPGPSSPGHFSSFLRAEASASSQTLRTTVRWCSFGLYSSTNSTSPPSILYAKFLCRLYQIWSQSLSRNGMISLRLRGQAATLERLRVDRQLEEALAHGPDPLHLAAVFGLDLKTAIRYAENARLLLTTGAEE